MKKIIQVCAGSVLMLMMTVSSAHAGEVTSPQFERQMDLLQSQVAELRDLLIRQQARINSQQSEIESLKLRVEPRERVVPSLPTPAPAALPAWADGLKMGGDFRLRYEAFSKAAETTRDRNRFRFRLRYGLEKQLSSDLAVGFRLTTGALTDPTGSNATMGGDFSFKEIFIDRAYAKYTPAWIRENVPSLGAFEMGGGKVANPYSETSGIMFWDPDVSPEGLYEKTEWSFSEGRFRPFTTLGQFLFAEQSGANDAELYAFQGGYRWNLSPDPAARPLEWTNAVAYYDFSDVTNSSNFVLGGTSLARGNTTRGSTDLAAGDFNILNFYQDLKFRLGPVPAKLFGEYDINLHDQTPDPDGRDQAYQIGLSLGSPKERGDWWLSYYYAYVEPNAILGAIAESDFGEGHTDKRGNNFEVAYMLTDFLKLRFRAVFANNVTGADDETRRFQTDLDWKF